MLLKTLALVIESMHYANFLDSPRKSRGGLMLVAQPESLKSEILEVLRGRSGVTYRDDIHGETIKTLLPQIAAGDVQTLVLPEFQKLFERRESTWKNTLGHLRAFVHDGVYQGSPSEAATIQERATCTVLGAVTPECYKLHALAWRGNGFGRRVLWAHYRITAKHKVVIKTAARLGVNLEIFEARHFPYIQIPVLGKDREKLKIDALFKKHVDPTRLPYDIETMRILYKVFDVLKWEESRQTAGVAPMEIMEDFIPSLGEYVDLDLPEEFGVRLEKIRGQREMVEEIEERSNGANGDARKTRKAVRK